MAKGDDATPKKQNWFRQLILSYRYARVSDKRLGLYTALATLLGLGLGGVLFWLLPPRELTVFKWIVIAVGAISLGLLTGLIVFSRRAQRAAYSQMEGQPGAAAGALSTLRRGWNTDTTPIAITKQQDTVHRVVGPPGIVLVGQGNDQRVRSLLAGERRKHERVVTETPVHEVIIGHGEDEVPLRKLTSHVMKLPKAVKPAEMTDILNRLKAIDARRPMVPLPKGPVPTSLKGLRGGLRGR